MCQNLGHNMYFPCIYKYFLLDLQPLSWKCILSTQYYSLLCIVHIEDDKLKHYIIQCLPMHDGVAVS